LKRASSLPVCFDFVALPADLLGAGRVLHQAQSHVMEANATSVMGSSLIRLLHERR